jgi:hypothetical protein
MNMSLRGMSRRRKAFLGEGGPAMKGDLSAPVPEHVSPRKIILVII